MIERCLGSVRLSVLTDATTSPERQREHIEAAALRREGRMVGWAEDLDVSASKVSPMNRPSLGPWFTERMDEWDTLIVWRLDRLVRKVGDLAVLIAWCEKYRKNIVSATEPFDLQTPLGKALVYLVAVFAEMEANTIRERVMGAQKALRESGRWGGGKTVLFGFKPVKRTDGPGWALEIDHESKRHLDEMIGRLIAGESMNAVVKDFNARGLISPSDRHRQLAGQQIKGIRWSVPNIRDLFRNPALLGYATHQDKVVRGADGLPVRKAPALVSQERFDELQAALNRRTHRPKRTHDVNPLLDIAHCGHCEGLLYLKNQQRRGKHYSYYVCSNKVRHSECDALPLRAVDVDGAVEDSLLAEIGECEVTRKVERAAQDHREELREIERALEELREDRAAGLYRGERGVQEYRAMYLRLEGKRENLETEVYVPARVEFVSTGETWRDKWVRSTSPERRELLLEAGITVHAMRDPVLRLDLRLPEDLRHRLGIADRVPADEV